MKPTTLKLPYKRKTPDSDKVASRPRNVFVATNPNTYDTPAATPLAKLRPL